MGGTGLPASQYLVKHCREVHIPLAMSAQIGHFRTARLEDAGRPIKGIHEIAVRVALWHSMLTHTTPGVVWLLDASPGYDGTKASGCCMLIRQAEVSYVALRRMRSLAKQEWH